MLVMVIDVLVVPNLKKNLYIIAGKLTLTSLDLILFL